MKIAIWVALVAVVIAAVVTTVVMLFGGSEVIKERKDRKQNVVPPPAALDAGPPPLDAAAEAETLEVTIKTEPPGAEIQVDGIDRGTSPVTVKLVVHDHFTEVIATLAGYEDKQIQFNTYVDKDPTYTLRLKKLARPALPTSGKTTKPPVAPPDTNKVDKTGGELHGNPFTNKKP